MSFRVTPADLKTYAGELDTVASASTQAVTYAAHTKPTASGGSAFVRFLNSTAEVRPAVEEFFTHLQRIAEASADELVATARGYEDTDAAAAAEADARYGQVGQAPTGGR